MWSHYLISVTIIVKLSICAVFTPNCSCFCIRLRALWNYSLVLRMDGQCGTMMMMKLLSRAQKRRIKTCWTGLSNMSSEGCFPPLEYACLLLKSDVQDYLIVIDLGWRKTKTITFCAPDSVKVHLWKIDTINRRIFGMFSNRVVILLHCHHL